MSTGSVAPTLTWDDFAKLDIRAGTILSAEPFPRARKPAYQLRIDFGEAGIRQSSAQITRLYTPEALVGRQVLAVINFPPKQIANFFSECLVLGVMNGDDVILLTPDRPVGNGWKVG